MKQSKRNMERSRAALSFINIVMKKIRIGIVLTVRQRRLIHNFQTMTEQTILPISKQGGAFK